MIEKFISTFGGGLPNPSSGDAALGLIVASPKREIFLLN